MRLTQIVEALLFASDAPLSAGDIALIDERLDEDTVEAVIKELREEYESQERAFTILDVAGGYQMMTRPEFAPYLERFDTVPQQTRLSAPALEVLAVIAYRQPIGRNEIEEIRGVGSSGVLKTLQDRNLIDVVGRSEGLGRPLLYGTTPKFLEHFGFRSLDDLPRPEDLPVILRSRPVEMTPVEELEVVPAVEDVADAIVNADTADTVQAADATQTAGTEETAEATVAAEQGEPSSTEPSEEHV
jgi:segregation and condensation protein B